MASDIIARGIAAKAAGDLSQFKEETTEALAGKADLQDGKVPASQLPSYVDDVVEYADIASFPETGEVGKIYVAMDTGYTYRWAGSDYIQIGGQDLSDIVTNFAQNYDNTATYAVGDFCTYENVFYVCSTAIDVAEAWNAAHWTRTTVATVIEARDAQIAALRQSVAKLGADLASPYDPTLTYKVGDLVMVDDELWKCATAVSQPETWDSSKWTKVGLEGAWAGKFAFPIINPPANTTLTDDEVAVLIKGCQINGDFAGIHNPTIFPATIYAPYGNGRKTGIVIGGSSDGVNAVYYQYVIYENSNEFRLFNKIECECGVPSQGWIFQNVRIAGDVLYKNKAFPTSYPSDVTKSYVLTQTAAQNGPLAWVEQINNLAPVYDATHTYKAGDVCMQNGALWQCNADIDPAEAWDASHWTQVQIDDVYASKKYFGFPVLSASDIVNNTLTDEQIELFKQGVVIRGVLFDAENPIFFSCQTAGNDELAGICILNNTGYIPARRICGYNIILSTKRLGVVTDAGIYFNAHGRDATMHFSTFNISNGSGGLSFASVTARNSLTIKSKDFPNYPSDVAKEYVLTQTAAANGPLAWQEKKYGSSISDNTLTELTYEKISVLSLSADKTFTLKAAQTDCIPEYKALITNSGSSAITLTFTGVGTIHTNDPNISLVAGTNSTATIPANVKVEVNIFDGDAIVYNKNAISFATTQEVEALF